MDLRGYGVQFVVLQLNLVVRDLPGLLNPPPYCLVVPVGRAQDRIKEDVLIIEPEYEPGVWQPPEGIVAPVSVQLVADVPNRLFHSHRIASFL